MNCMAVILIITSNAISRKKDTGLDCKLVSVANANAVVVIAITRLLNANL